MLDEPHSCRVPLTRASRASRAFTLIELLVVIGIIGLLTSILLPALSGVRSKARATKCLSNLHVLGHGITLYANDNDDALMPSRLPKHSGDSCNPYATLFGRRKYRPTFLAMMSLAVGVPPFEDPKACKNEVDMFGEPGDQQDYSYPLYVCPSVADWTDERNGSYGWNYQFLGNSRLLDSSDQTSYKNWAVPITRIRYPGRTVAVADCMGTAASFTPAERLPYIGNSRDDDERFGNEGFNLDPPRVDPVNGEMANLDAPQSRTAADPRHSNSANVLWLDGHANWQTLTQLGYQLDSEGRVVMYGDKVSNTMWSGNGTDVAWTPEFTP